MSDIELVDEEYGSYVIKHQIGKGAFGNVYKALDRDSGQEVALKVSIRLSLLSRIRCGSNPINSYPPH